MEELQGLLGRSLRRRMLGLEVTKTTSRQILCSFGSKCIFYFKKCLNPLDSVSHVQVASRLANFDMPEAIQWLLRIYCNLYIFVKVSVLIHIYSHL